MKDWLWGFLFLLAIWPLAAQAGTMLFDFEDEAEIKVWHDEGRPTTNRNFPVSREARFAVSGRYALCLRTPQWRPGMSEWPAVEANPALKDWQGYDRLFFALTNATPYPQRLMLFITDSKVLVRAGLYHRVVLAPFSYQAVEIPLAGLTERKINPADITTLHFFTERPVGDMEVYMDAVQLLKPGESAPQPPMAYLQDFARLQEQQITLLRQRINEIRAAIRQMAAGQAAASNQWAENQLAEYERQISAFAQKLAHPDDSIFQGALLSQKLEDNLIRLLELARLRTRFEAIRPRVGISSQAPEDMIVGFASSMEKILPRAQGLELQIRTTVSLSLARNEKESLQVIVLPLEKAAKNVTVCVADLQDAQGHIFPAEAIKVAPVGYVETKAVPPYGSPHVGWWPDPILEFMGPVDIQPRDAQAFWLRFRAGKQQPPGRYRGKLEVIVEDEPVYAFNLRVDVYPFVLPDRSPLDLAITFGPHDHPLDSTKAAQLEWRKSPDYPINAWKRHRLEWGDFLADYYITYDSLYHHSSPDFEILQRLQKRGQLGRFNLGYYAILGEKPEEQEAWRKNTLARIKAAYEQAKALGLLEHAYIYGCDENPEELFPGVERAARLLKQECPGVTIMTTTYDHSYGTQTVIKSMDAFCPLTPRYDRALAERVRAEGKQVWWYICCGPHHPYCNMFVEYPAIEGRLLMGAQTAKYRPDGFLYYQISIWNAQKPITSGPFTDWDPRSWTTYHGDGSWTCVGPDGTPLPTIRLENFRDGLEDYAYAVILEHIIQAYEAKPQLTAEEQAWLKEAKAALAVPEKLVKSMSEYSREPAELYAWRNRMARAICSSGMTDINPWPKIFSRQR